MHLHPSGTSGCRAGAPVDFAPFPLCPHRRHSIKLPNSVKVKATQDGGLVLAYVLDEGDVFLFVHFRPRLVIENAVASIRRREIKKVIQRRQEIVHLGNEGGKTI